MMNWLKCWSPENLIALVIVLGCIGLLASGLDGEVKGILAVAAGWVFKSAAVKKDG